MRGFGNMNSSVFRGKFLKCGVIRFTIIEKMLQFESSNEYYKQIKNAKTEDFFFAPLDLFLIYSYAWEMKRLAKID
jgi:hypothetical protein